MTYQQLPSPEDAKLLLAALAMSLLLMTMSCGPATTPAPPDNADLVPADTLPADNTRVQPDTLR